MQYDRDSANGSCALYVYERCPKDANGGWSRQESQILNIYAYHYWDGATAASGKTGWGDAPTKEYSELTGSEPDTNVNKLKNDKRFTICY
ncbi:hypothetical protein NIA69_15750 [Gemmiger formicilis]|nr:hypothetical protein [Gemmiger formicilis]